ncbi:calcium/proton exchanger [Cladophialophora carrionii CBS 160.54]|uniref:Calcium/proton exchanger n=1 Tax=Cladophialophora carrionii CBS 160.54 TaxID=1279043 RepID=V9D6S0_9EURO|nr:calcium/proton exchanger [Cladophialophora carrionii CBS 160.54]ETI22570.1 calcium/proton exchanger [Cladophialophora carrionii CBS 160.54]
MRPAGWIPRLLHRLTHRRAGVHRHERSSPEESSPISTAERKWYSRYLAEAFVTIRDILFYSKLNVLLIAVPLAITSYLVHTNRILVFAANLIAVVPLSSLLTCATENIARESGDVVGALVNVTFGNLVEIVILIALYHNRLEVVQASLLGSILVNLLLILGIAILAGSFHHHQLAQNKEDAQTLACLLSFSVLSLLIPNAFYHSFQDAEIASAAVLTLSRVSSLTLLVVYLLYICLQIRKIPRHHPSIDVMSFDELSAAAAPSQDARSSSALLLPRSIRFQDEEAGRSRPAKTRARGDSLEMSALGGSGESQDESEELHDRFDLESSINGEELEPSPQSDKGRNSRSSIYQHPFSRQRSESLQSSNRYTSPAGQQRSRHHLSFSGSSTSLPRLLVGSSRPSAENLCDVYAPQESPPKIGRVASSLLLVISSLLVALCAEFMVDTLDDMVESGPFPQAFIGLIILPIAGNCAELFTATYVAAHGNFDLAIGVSVGSSVQISLLVTPLIVIAGWILQKDMTMYFDLFGTVALFATTFLVNVLIVYGKSNFLEGSLLFACYFIIAVGAYLFPAPENRAE